MSGLMPVASLGRIEIRRFCTFTDHLEVADAASQKSIVFVIWEA